MGGFNVKWNSEFFSGKWCGLFIDDRNCFFNDFVLFKILGFL